MSQFERDKKVIITLLISSLCLVSCSSDDANDCPETIVIETQEDLELAERCGLTPADPLGKFQ